MRLLALLFISLLVLAGAWVWQASRPRALESAPLERAVSPPARERGASGALAAAPRPSPGEPGGQAARPGSRRQELGQDPAARDDLFEASPPRPEPGHYETPFLQERHENGELYFEAQQAQDPGGLWLLHGRWTSWYENGQKQEEGWYDMNRETGQWQWWDENGQEVARGFFVRGEREGPWSFWYSNGVKQADANYRVGDGEGLWTLYFDDGQKNAEGQFIAGEIAGYWTIWDEFGEVNPERTGFYEAGELVSH